MEIHRKEGKFFDFNTCHGQKGETKPSVLKPEDRSRGKDRQATGFIPCTVTVCLQQRIVLPQVQGGEEGGADRIVFLTCYLGASYLRNTQGTDFCADQGTSSQLQQVRTLERLQKYIWRNCLHDYLLKLETIHEKVAR